MNTFMKIADVNAEVKADKQFKHEEVALTGADLGLMALSNVRIHKQLESVSASLAATTLSYNQYRQRVIEDRCRSILSK